jgi:hypothetical protein
MKALSRMTALILVLASSLMQLRAQDQKPANLAAAPPNIALLEHREIFPGKSADHKKLFTALAHASYRGDSQRFWIELESLTGNLEEIIFTPFDSYEQIEQSNTEWNQFLGTHPDVERARGEIEGQLESRRRVTAVRRDDLGYLVENIDFSEMRFVSILEVRLFPGHEDDFVEAFQILADAYAKIHADASWVIYEVDAGTTSPTFLVIRPMPELKQNDEILSFRGNLADAEGEQSVETLKRIAHESFVSMESNIYSVNPDMSHVSKAFAATDPNYWLRRSGQEGRPETKPDAKAAPTP